MEVPFSLSGAFPGLRRAAVGQMSGQDKGVRGDLLPIHRSPKDELSFAYPQPLVDAMTGLLQLENAPVGAGLASMSDKGLLGLLGVVPTGGALTTAVRGAPKSAVGVFGGRLGAKNLDAAKFAGRADRMKLLDEAIIQADSGVDPDSIRMATGWFKGVDGKWRFEIDDSAARLTDIGRRDKAFGSMGRVMEHPELYAAYPDLKNVDTVVKTAAGAPTGKHIPYKDRGSDTFPIQEEIHSAGPLSERMSTLLHEGQHSVQGKEGFARGGSPSNFDIESLKVEATKRYDDEIMRVWNERPDIAQKFENLRFMESSLEQKYGDSWLFDITKDEGRRYDAALKALRKDPDGKSILDAHYEKEFILSKPERHWRRKRFDKYRMLSGEVEARNVQERAGLSDLERRMIDPHATMDVPAEKQIMRGVSDDIALMSNDDLIRYARQSHNKDTPFNDVDYAMFAEIGKRNGMTVEEVMERLSIFGSETGGRWVTTSKNSVDISDIQKDIVKSLRKRGVHNEYGTTAAGLARDANPDDIVNSAGLWDNPELVSMIYEDVLEPKGITAVRTQDGIIRFDQNDVRRYSPNDPDISMSIYQ